MEYFAPVISPFVFIVFSSSLFFHVPHLSGYYFFSPPHFAFCFYQYISCSLRYYTFTSRLYLSTYYYFNLLSLSFLALISLSFTILPFYFMSGPLFQTPSILLTFAFFFLSSNFFPSAMLPLKHFLNIDIWLNTPCNQFVFLFQYLSKQAR